MTHSIPASPVLMAAVLCLGITTAAADEFDLFIKPLFQDHCTRCHGSDETNGKIDLHAISSKHQWLGNASLIKEVIEVIDANDMPPEGEPQLSAQQRVRLLSTLKEQLREATVDAEHVRMPIRRLNRFQYNNAVKDLFGLKRDVFSLPEKLMTRHSNYLLDATGQMASRVNVASHALAPAPGLSEVNAFPKDLRATHGFDNQANQLTLSPLLLDAFLRLSVSIVQSPDFNENTVGKWHELFAEPTPDANLRVEIRDRLQPFLSLAFRRKIDAPTLNRYVDYALKKIDQGMPVPTAMKKVTSAALSSPMFLYRTGALKQGRSDQLQLASNLAFFLWGSGPDLALLELADKGELGKPAILRATIDRMIADPKIERFLDTFPTQWMQLENVLAATPDPQKQRYFSLDKKNPASLHMLLEPLLLFDAMFIENRSINEMISPEFVYQSEFLKTWYTSELKPPPVDVARITEANRANDEKRESIQRQIDSTQDALNRIVQPIRERLLAQRAANNDRVPVDLKPFAAWEFDGDLKSSINSLDLVAHGDIQFADGGVVLKRSFLQSPSLPIELKAKSLEVWFKLHDENQRGGGVMGIQGPGDFFDTIVLGERKPKHWISGSNGFSRTKDFPESFPESQRNELLHLVMVYQADGTTMLYRNGVPYGKPFHKGSATFPKDKTSVLFGLRHLPAGGNKYLSITVDKAHLYDRALTADEVAASAAGYGNTVTDKELNEALTPTQRALRDQLASRLESARAELKRVPANQDAGKAIADVQRRFDDEIRAKIRSRTFDRVVATDPRYGGVITNAAILSMTSGPKRTHPIARGAWIIEVIFNDPPPPPPNDVPPLNEEQTDKNLTIREKFAVHRENADCAACHSRLDPLGFALENFDITGRWRDKYENGRDVDSTGMLMRKYEFDGIVNFKKSLMKEERRFAKAFTAHLLRFALARELMPQDALTVEDIVERTSKDGFRLKSLLREVASCEAFVLAE